MRRERPHPGAQLDVFEERDSYRYQAMATNTRVGQLAFLEARHRAHAQVEDRIGQIQDAGLGRLPSRWFAINQAWLELALAATDLLAWTQTILLVDQPHLAKAEWKTIRYTGCCTPPPASPAPPGAPGSACRQAGHRPSRWPTPSRSLRRIPVPA